MVVGSVNLDLVVVTPRLPRAHEKLRVGTWAAEDGGAGGNTASWLAYLGRDVELVSVVGNDAIGKHLLATLRHGGVETRWIRSVETASAIAISLSTGKEKRILALSGPSPDTAILAYPRDHFDPLTHLHLVGEITPESRALVEDAKARGSSISVEGNGYDPSPILELVDLCMMNSDELREIDNSRHRTDEARARALISEHPGWLVVTQGASGAIAVSRETVERISTIQIDPIDRTGAGDAFDAAFLDSWTRNRRVETALSEGLELAAEVLQQIGSRPRPRS